MTQKTRDLEMIFLFCIVCVLFPVANSHSVSYDEKYFTQDADHFNFYTKDTFKHRYLMQDKWWSNRNGPIFFYTGNEADIEDFWKNTGFIFENAPKFQALVIFAEHRFYGKSLPYGNASFQHPHVDLLTMEQALADFACLISHIKQEYNATQAPVISFGGSYGGMLTIYLRAKYPNLVDGGLAASAPILLVSRDVPRDFFFPLATKDYRDAVPGCEATFRSSFSKLQAIASTVSGLKQISLKFNTCEDLQNQADFKHLLGWIRNSLTNLAMFDYPYPTTFFSELPAYPVKVACQKLMSQSDAILGLSQAASLYYGNPKCHDIYTEFTECSDPTGCGTGQQGLAWDYQACTEFLMPAGTNNVTDLFPFLPFSLEQRETYCQKRWGVKPRLDWIKISLWGKAIQHTSNLILSNGDLDPWRGGGILEDVSDSVVALLVEGGAHHLDLRSSNPMDPDSVKQVRKKELDIIHSWIMSARKRNHAEL